MRRKGRQSALIISVAAGLITFASSAAADENVYRFEITPYTAYRMGGDFSSETGPGRIKLQDSDAFGIILNGTVSPETQWEFLYGRQGTEADVTDPLGGVSIADLDVSYYHLGGTYLFGEGGMRPFIAATFGVSSFDPALADLGSENFPSGSLGAGVFLGTSNRLGVRLEGRVFTTFINNNSNIFCGFTGSTSGCLIEVSGSTFTQWEARAGLVFRF